MMSPDPRLRIELNVAADQPNLLAGLETLLQLGLISDSQVRRIARHQLCCDLPPLQLPSVATMPLEIGSQDSLQEVASAAERGAPLSTNPSENLLWVGLRAWTAELSVRWLLFVGVFLVVLSSAVLAASQWQYFPPVGQYGILLAYTLAFWFASVWTRKYATLRLTSQMLVLTTLLIIPINFWVIDAFGLFRSGLGWIVAIAASIGLTAMGFRLLKPYLDFQLSQRLGYTGLFLPWLQWGWNLPGIPLFAPYAGTILTTVVLLWIDRKSSPIPSLILSGPVVVTDASAPSSETATRQPAALLWITLLGSVLLLLGRAVLVRHVPLEDMGLAVALCGWLMAVLHHHPPTPLWKTLGIGLLLLGRLQVIPADSPWPALIISGLALFLFWDWLKVQQDNSEGVRSPTMALLALWITHIQALWPLWRLVPTELQTWLVTFPTQWVGTEGMPEALLGVVLLPDLALHLKVAQIFHQRQKSVLVRITQRLTLIFWIGLTLISLANPGLRSLNLTLSAMALIVYAQRRPVTSLLWVYGIQCLTIAAIASWITTLWPNLSDAIWAGLLLVGCLGEWVLAGWRFQTALWQRSAWISGIVLSSLSYLLILAESPLPDWTGIWYAIPAMATILARRGGFPFATPAAIFSTLLLIVTPVLSFNLLIPRLVGFAIATGLMVFNSRQVPHLIMAAIAVGFGVTGVWVGLFALDDRLTLTIVLNAPLVVNGLLWGFRDWFRRQSSTWHLLYQQALGGWAMTLHHLHLCLISGLILASVLFPSSSLGDADTHWPMGLVMACVLSVLVIVYRLWQVSGNWGYCLLAWSLQLFSLTITLVIWKSPETAGLAEFGLAFLALSAGFLWTRGTQQPYLASWHGIPIVFAVIARLIQLHTWTALSGLGTLAVAAVFLIVGQRSLRLRWLTFTGVGLVTAGLYDLLIYQLMQSPGGQPGDSWVILSLLAALLGLVYRLLTTQLITRLALPRMGGLAIAHAHWGLGHAFLLGALSAGLTRSGEWALVGVTVVLASYAIGQGRQVPVWIYLGAAEIYLAISGVCALVFPSWQMQMWAAAIAALVATITCAIPWSRWGWRDNPWHRSAGLLPGLVLLLTLDHVTILSLFVVAGFYVGFAQLKSAIRWSYLSVLIADWAILRLLHRYQWSGSLASLFLASASFLYVAEVDPALNQIPAQRERHLLRLFAIAIMGIAALHESDGQFLWGLVAAGLGLAVAGVGLMRRIRAFLYGGTLLFVLKVFRQLWLFIADYSLLLWAIGIALGLLLIWIAATFESRRSETLALLRHWQAELADWE